MLGGWSEIAMLVDESVDLDPDCRLNPRVYAAVESLLSVQLEGGETTGAESGERVEAAPKV